MGGALKVLIVLIGIVNLVASVYYTGRFREIIKALPEPERKVASAAPTEGHGEAKAEAHGGGHDAPPAGEHGAAPAPAPAASAKPRSWVTFDEMFVNILNKDEDVHTLAFKLEVELFDEGSRQIMEQRQAVVKNAVIEVARLQPYDELATLAGKLYFKEAVVLHVNQTLKIPLVRDVHLASFSLR